MNENLINSITYYLSSGGLFNPELADHLAVRNLLMECREALAQPEPAKIAHKHEWFRTGEMKVGQMRCISCGTWGQEEMPQRTWVGLTDEERNHARQTVTYSQLAMTAGEWAEKVQIETERRLKEKNT